MLEFLVVVMAMFLAIGFVVLLFKALFALVLIPVKIGFFLIKGLLVLVFAVPIALVSFGLVSLAFPLVLTIVALPVVLAIAGVVCVLRFFC
jgi:hypothetical protein